MVAAIPVREEPERMVVYAPESFQLMEDRLWQREKSLLVAFPHDAQGHIGALDSVNIQGNSLADAQAASVHQGQTNLVGGSMDAIQEMADFKV
jgi:hypothetical protein